MGSGRLYHNNRPAKPGRSGTFTIELAETGLTVPEHLPAGIVSITFNNKGKVGQHLSLVRLNPGVTPEKFQATLAEWMQQLRDWGLSVGVYAGVVLALELGQVLFFSFGFLFPDGRFVPRWTWVLAVAALVEQAAEKFYAGSEDNWPLVWQVLPFFGLLILAVIAQIYRYQRVSTPVQRQQTKWVVFGVAVGFSGFLGLILLFVVLWPDLQRSLVANWPGWCCSTASFCSSRPRWPWPSSVPGCGTLIFLSTVP